MKTSKLILTTLVGLALVAMLSLAACGGSDAAEDEVAEAPAPVEAPEEPAANGPADATAADQAATSDDIPFAGTWELTGFLDGDKLMTVDEYAADVDANPSTFPTTYELRADGTAIAHNSITGDVEATWQAGEHEITVIASDATRPSPSHMKELSFLPPVRGSTAPPSADTTRMPLT